MALSRQWICSGRALGCSSIIRAKAHRAVPPGVLRFLGGPFVLHLQDRISLMCERGIHLQRALFL